MAHTTAPQIVILDGYTLNPGDLSWDPIRSLGSCTIYDRTRSDEIVQRAAHAEIVLTNKVPLSRETLQQLRNVRYIGVLATGYNIVDVAAARDRGITVTNVPAYSTMSVAQHVFALILELTHHTGMHSESVRAGEWVRSSDFAYWKSPLVELNGKKLGIIGFGNIGRAVARIGEAFGMKIIAHTANVPRTTGDIAVHFTDLDTLFRESDVLSLHCPLTPATEKLVNAQRLSLMKPSAWIINTSRGPVIDEQALADALNAEKLGGAAVDVLSTEPPNESNPLLKAKNIIITPHFAWATRAARQRLMDTVTQNVKAFMDGAPVNIVG